MEKRRKNMGEKGQFIEWLLMLLAISVVIFFILIPKEKRFGFSSPIPDEARDGVVETNENTRTSSPRTLLRSGSTQSTVRSSSKAPIQISRGNASREDNPMSEYIILENRSNANVDITGWRLENGKGARVTVISGHETRIPSDSVTLTQGTKLLTSNGVNIMQNIVLKPGEDAIIITGSPANISKFPLTSFKENMCTGYLEELHTFPAGHDMSCMDPEDEMGVSSRDSKCQDFIDSLKSCRLPKFGAVNASGDIRDSKGETCKSCINGVSGLSNECRAFVKERYSYEGCVNNHRNDPNFEGDTWHIYLRQRWQLWEEEDTISLYNSSGQLVDTYSY